MDARTTCWICLEELLSWKSIFHFVFKLEELSAQHAVYSDFVYSDFSTSLIKALDP